MKVTVTTTYDITIQHGRVGVETIGDIGRSYFIHEYGSVPPHLLDEHLDAFEAALHDSTVHGDFGDVLETLPYDLRIVSSTITQDES